TRDRRLLPPDRPRRPPRDACGPRGRPVARVEERPGPRLPLRRGLLLPAFRARLPPSGLRRAGAGGAVQRFDPVRVLRVYLPSRLAPGGRMGGAGVAAREIPRLRGGRASPSL